MAQGKFSNPRPPRDDSSLPQPTEEVQNLPLFPESDNDLTYSESNFEYDEPDDASDTVWDKILDFGGQLLSYVEKNRKVILTVACGFTLLLIICVMSMIFSTASDPYNGKILSNVYLADINVGGMTKNEAVSAVKNSIAEDFSWEYMVVDLSGTTLRLSPADVDISLDIKRAVDDAYNYGRTGTQSERDRAYQNSKTERHIIALLPYMDLNEDYIRDVLNAYSADASSDLTQPHYLLEGDAPELSTDKFDPDAPCQTLVITTGIPGISFHVNDVFNMILDAYSLHQFQVVVTDVTPVTDPDPVDLQAIYNAVCREPVDAGVNMSNYEAIPGAYGYAFDMEAAQQLIDQAGYGDTIRIPMKYIEPEILENEVFFQDVLGSVQTPHTNNENRNTNLRLACEAINGLVLNPGDVFSYNETLGKRTEAKGYKPAPTYIDDELVDSVGGGICQVSSTLYCCTLLSDLETVERTSHSFPSSYIEYGLDATVSWGGPDFQFRNSTNFPIKLVAEVSDGYVKVSILGTDKRSYYIKMESVVTATHRPETKYEDFEFNNAKGYEDGDVIRKGVTGYSVKTYKLKYDKQTDSLISRDFVANTRYKTIDQVIARVEPEPTEVTTEPEETVPGETTPGETEPPTQPTEPPTEPPVTEPSTQPTEPPSVTEPVIVTTPVEDAG